MRTVDEQIRRLSGLWVREHQTATAQAAAARLARPLEERVARGQALCSVRAEEVLAAAGGHTVLWVSCPRELRLHLGDPLSLWWGAPEEAQSTPAVAGRRRGGSLSLLVEGEPPERLITGHFHVDRAAPQQRFRRGERALSIFLAAHSGPLGRLRSVVFGRRPPAFDLPRDWAPLDPSLNGAQRTAVAYALAAQEVALLHGPPGTGKTRTLVEVVRQVCARGHRVLACAGSNLALDHLGAGLMGAGLKVLRLGHPARVHPELEAQTLDAQLERTGAWRRARHWMSEATNQRGRALRRRARGSLNEAELRAQLADARRLERDARTCLAEAQRLIMERAEVICATAAGAGVALLADQRFDLLVIDEATQLPDPMALVPMSRARRVVLAGDPEQLPPTILDPRVAAEGLGRTFFERLAESAPEAVRTLTVQYRMNEVLMAFPNRARYRGRLVAAGAVRGQRLEDLGARPDPLRPGPLVLVDTAGTGWEDSEDAERSALNHAQADRTAAEVRRLLSRGLSVSQVALLTPYSAQRRLLRALLAAEVEAGLEVATVDGFQGREAEAVVVDLVRSNAAGEVGFVRDRRRLNVALTRARRLLLVVADTATLGQHPDFADLLEVVDELGAWVSAWSDEAAPLPPLA